MKTISNQEFKSLYGSDATSGFQPIEQKNTFGERISTDFKSRLEKTTDTLKSVSSGETNLGQGAVNVVGQVAGGVTDVISNVIKSVPGSETVGNVVKGFSEKIADIVTENPNILNGLNAINSGIDSYEKWSKENPEDSKTIDAVFNIASLLPVGKSAGIVSRGAVRTAEELATASGNIFSKAKSLVAPVAESTKGLVEGVKNIGEITADTVGRIPSRIATNVAEKQATKQTINSLPTEIAKTAARDGIDIKDIKYLYEIPKEQKKPLSDLLQSVKDFESGKSKTNPIEIVGKPIVDKIKLLDSEAGKVGQELGEVAKTLGNVSKEELLNPVFENLKKVRGLNGLKIKEKGVLDFSDTVLTTAETASDRKAIQSIFTQAIQDGTGISKHRLRQELFEILGGKKKSLSSITETQDSAYQAVRKGLSDVLDTKNNTYKELNQKYAKISEPLSDMRKFMKNVSSADEDLLDMSAGLIARRLTSLAPSNPQIRKILRAMDEALGKEGATELSVENLQDFYNVLDKYYDITGKTSLQGQVTTGIEKASGFKDIAAKKLRELAGESDAVKRKALEDALDEALNN